MKLALVGLAGAAGAASTLPHVHTEAWWLGILCAAVLAHLTWRLAPVWAGAAAAGFSAGWVVAGTWWLHISMHQYGGLSFLLAALAVLALGAALSLYAALAVGLAALWRTGRARWDLPAFAAAWMMAELARGQWLTGFPWVASGYAQVDGPLAGWAPWVGVYGVGGWVALLGAALAWLLRQTGPGPGGTARAPTLAARTGACSVTAALACLPLMAPSSFTVSAGTLPVSLIQTGVPQDRKFDPSVLSEQLLGLQEAVQRALGALVVAPETAVPLLPRDIPPQAWSGLSPPLADTPRMPRAVLLGVPLTTASGGYTNSVIALAAGAGPTPLAGEGGYRYDKHHLVPFGEFIPPGFGWFVAMMDIPLGDFERGALVQASFEFAGQRLAPNICYEDLFGEELARRFHDPSGAPTMLVNLSNIAWFGPTMAIEQHLNISRMRSLELQRPMLRATNTGATAAIDHLGRVTARLEPQRAGVLEAQAEGRVGLTPYAQWVGRWGLAPLWLLGLGLMALAWRARRASPGRT